MNSLYEHNNSLLPYLFNLPSSALKTHKIHHIPIKLSSDTNYSWVTVIPEKATFKSHGWKLHVSTTIYDAISVLKTALIILINENVIFKFPSDLEILYQLNAGYGSSSQAGKYITIYPSSDEQAVKLAWRLHEALLRYGGPRILSDQPLQPNSLVHYRWGSFINHYAQTLFGEIIPTIKLDNQRLIADYRIPFYVNPSLANNPFKVEKNTIDTLYRLVNKRYLVAKLVTRSLNSDIMLAIDIKYQRRCILKLARRYSLLDTKCRDMRYRLLAEKKILNALKPNPFVPEVYGSFYDEEYNFILALEDIPGNTLEDTIINNQCTNKLPTSVELFSLAWNLSLILLKIHECNIIHADLKLSNIILNQEKIYLIDFNTSYEIGSNGARLGGGTIGFSSPQLASGSLPCIKDDIYSLGAILFYFATNGIPGKTAYIDKKSYSFLEYINPNINYFLKNLIFSCLEIAPEKRPHSAYEMLKLVKQYTLDPLPNHPLRFKKRDSKYYLEQAYKWGNYLIKHFFNPVEPGCGFALSYNSTLSLHDLRGTAGCVMGLILLTQISKKELFKSILMQTTFSLASSNLIDCNLIPGLYVGESGIALALFHAGKTLDNPFLVSEALKRLEKIRYMPHESPDLFNGTAGRLRTALIIYHSTQESKYLEIAKEAVEALLKQVKYLSNSTCCWVIPDTSSFPSNVTFNHETKQLGYAHGAAGIGDALLDYYLTIPDLKVKKVILSATQWIMENNYSTLPEHDFNKTKLNWPIAANEEPTTPFWCHGSTGIGYFLLRLAKANLFPRGKLLAQHAAYSVAQTKWASPIQCHGLSANIDYLLTTYRATNDPIHLEQAHSLADLLDLWTARLSTLPWGLSDFEPRSYMCGIPGIIAAYLNLARPCSQKSLLMPFDFLP